MLKINPQSASTSLIPRRSSRSPARTKKAELVKPVKNEVTVKAAAAAKSATAKSATVTETFVTRRTITSSSGDCQQQASVTPVRSSARIAAIIEREVR